MVVIVVNDVVVVGKNEKSVQWKWIQLTVNEASPASRAGKSVKVGDRLLLLRLAILSLSEKQSTSRDEWLQLKFSTTV